MLRPVSSLLVLAILATAVPATAAPADSSLTQAIADLATELTTLRDTIGDPAGDRVRAKAIKAIDKVRKVLAKDCDSSFEVQVKCLGKMAKLIEKKLSSQLIALGEASMDNELRGHLLGAGDRVRSLIQGAISVAELSVGKNVEKNIAKAENLLAKAELRDDLFKAFKDYLKAAKKVADSLEILVGNQGGQEGTWVINGLSLGGPGEGVDLNGDGKPDNVLGSLTGLLPGLDFDLDGIFDQLFTGEINIIIQLWGYDDFDTDPLVFGGFINGIDIDGDPSDNFSGTEVFDPGDSLDAEGHAVVNSPMSFGPGGTFEFATASIPGLEFGDIALPEGTTIKLGGVASADGVVGGIGLAIPVGILTDLVELQSGEALSPLIAIALQFLLDIDTDGDGTNDAISAALVFTSVPCTLLTPEE